MYEEFERYDNLYYKSNKSSRSSSLRSSKRKSKTKEVNELDILSIDCIKYQDYIDVCNIFS